MKFGGKWIELEKNILSKVTQNSLSKLITIFFSNMWTLAFKPVIGMLQSAYLPRLST